MSPIERKSDIKMSGGVSKILANGPTISEDHKSFSTILDIFINYH